MFFRKMQYVKLMNIKEAHWILRFVILGMRYAQEIAINIDGYKTICCNVNKGGCGAASGYAIYEALMIEKWNMRAGEENERP